MKKQILLSSIFFTLMPVVASAQTFGNAITSLNSVIGAIIPMLISLATAVFLWGVTKYMVQAGDPRGRAEGRKVMIFGIVALFVIVSVWGLVGLVKETLVGPGIDVIEANANITPSLYSHYLFKISGFISGVLVPFIFGLGLIYYIWNVIRYMSNSGNDTERTKAVKGMFYGIIALFVMSSVWGLVAILTEIVGIGIGIPQIDSL